MPRGVTNDLHHMRSHVLRAVGGWVCLKPSQRLAETGQLCWTAQKCRRKRGARKGGWDEWREGRASWSERLESSHTDMPPAFEELCFEVHCYHRWLLLAKRDVRFSFETRTVITVWDLIYISRTFSTVEDNDSRLLWKRCCVLFCTDFLRTSLSRAVKVVLTRCFVQTSENITAVQHSSVDANVLRHLKPSLPLSARLLSYLESVLTTQVSSSQPPLLQISRRDLEIVGLYWWHRELLFIISKTPASAVETLPTTDIRGPNLY